VTLNAFIKQEATRERTTSGWQECIVTLVYRLTIWQQEGYLFHSTLGFDSRHQQTPMTRVDVKYVKRASFVLFFGILHLKETASQPDRDCQHTKKTWMLIHLSFITLGLRPPQNWHHRGFFRSLTLFHKVSSCVFFLAPTICDVVSRLSNSCWLPKLSPAASNAGNQSAAGSPHDRTRLIEAWEGSFLGVNVCTHLWLQSRLIEQQWICI
jgi:hypothetical protein